MTVYTSALAIVIVSILGSFFMVRKNSSLDQQVIRILTFGLYFWVLTFAQVIIYALVYQFVFR